MPIAVTISAAVALEFLALSFGFLLAAYYQKAMVVGLIVTALLGLIYWIKGYRRVGVSTDTPLSKIASAAQGPVGLRGKARAGKELLYTPISSNPCVWYSYSTVENSSRDSWYLYLLMFKFGEANTSSPPQEESENYFYIEDSSGQCLINPRRGDFSVVRSKATRDGRRTHIEQWLPESTWINVFGDFRTLDTGTPALRRETNEVILKWREDWSALIDRFDTNKDGTLDQVEWEKVRQEAMKIAGESIANIPRYTHTLSATDEEPLYVFEGRPDAMRRKYNMWASGQFMVFIGSIIALAVAPWWLSAVNAFSALVQKVHLL